MADEIDRASDREQLDRDLAIAAALHAKPKLPWVGECYNCASSVPVGMRWCDAACRTDWEQRRNAEIRRGRDDSRD